MSASEGAYSVKDFLAIHTKALERIERKVDEGALRQAEVIGRLEVRVSLLEQRENLEPRVRSLEDVKAHLRGERDFRRYLWPTIASVALAVLSVIHFVHP